MFNRLRSTAFYRSSERRVKPVGQLLRKFMNDWSLDLASMVAYNLLIAVLPMAVALFGILALVLENYPDAQDDIKNKIINSFTTDNSTRAGIQQVDLTRSFVLRTSPL